MEKTFTVVGVSTLNGVVKLRFANDMDKRMKILGNPNNPTGQHIDIRLFELASAMNKLDAAKELLANEHFEDVAPIALAFIERNS